MSRGHSCSAGCSCPLARGLTLKQAADERQAALVGCTPAEAEVDRLRARVRELEAERKHLRDALVAVRAAAKGHMHRLFWEELDAAVQFALDGGR